MKRLIIVFGLFLSACVPNAATYNNAANRHFAAGDIEQAQRAYQSAQVVEPDNALLYFNAAGAIATAVGIEAAAENLRFAVERGNDRLVADAQYNLGVLYFQAAEYEQAIAAFQEALRKEPNNADARFNLELAMAQLIQPTPTAQEMQTAPDKQTADPEMTPTPNPGGQMPPSTTPTPPPDGTRIGPTPVDGGSEGAPIEDLRSTPLPEVDGFLTIDQAERILDPIKFEADALGTFRFQQATPSARDSQRDW